MKKSKPTPSVSMAGLLLTICQLKSSVPNFLMTEMESDFTLFTFITHRWVCPLLPFRT